MDADLTMFPVSVEPRAKMKITSLQDPDWSSLLVEEPDDPDPMVNCRFSLMIGLLLTTENASRGRSVRKEDFMMSESNLICCERKWMIECRLSLVDIHAVVE